MRVRVRVSACADAEVVALELVVVARKVRPRICGDSEASIEFSHFDVDRSDKLLQSRANGAG